MDVFSRDTAFGLHGSGTAKAGTFRSLSTETLFRLKYLGAKQQVFDGAFLLLVLLEIAVMTGGTSGAGGFGVRGARAVVAVCAVVLQLLHAGAFERLKSAFTKQSPGAARRAALQKQQQQKQEKKGSRNAKKGVWTEYLLKKRLLLLIFLRETDILSDPTQLSNPYFFVTSLVLAILTHLLWLENMDSDTKEIRSRLALKTAVLVIITWETGNWKSALWIWLGFLIIHVILLNSMMMANKISRKMFSLSEASQRWGEQVYDLVDSQPFPIFLIEKSAISEVSFDNRPLVKIAYFNLAAEDLLPATETDPDAEKTTSNFLDLIDEVDVANLVELVSRLSPKTGQLTFTAKAKWNHSSDSKKGNRFYDITVWETKWKEKPMIALLFNDEAYVGSKSSRYATKYQKGLTHLLKSTQDNLVKMAMCISKFNSKQLDPTKLVDSASAITTDLWVEKHLIDNFIMFDGAQDDEMKRKQYRFKALVLNVVDMLAPSLNKKGCNVSLTFSQRLPQFVTCNLSYLSSLLLNLMKYFEITMKGGSLSIEFQWETHIDNTFTNGVGEDLPKELAVLNLLVSAQAAQQNQRSFAQSDFLGLNSKKLKKDYETKEDMLQLVLLWIGKLKKALAFEVNINTKTISETTQTLK